MDKTLSEIKGAIAIVISALTAFWGWAGWVVLAWIGAMGLDWLTGTAAAWKAGKWSSKVARDGAWHKLGAIVAVLVSALLDLVLGLLCANLPVQLPFTYSMLLCPLVLIWYILTEAGSIIENAGELGAPIPAWLRKAIAAFRDRVDIEGNDWDQTSDSAGDHINNYRDPDQMR